MIRLAYPLAGEVWVNADLIRSIVSGQTVEAIDEPYRGPSSQHRYPTSRIRFANEDGEMVVRGTPEEVVALIDKERARWQPVMPPPLMVQTVPPIGEG